MQGQSPAIRRARREGRRGARKARSRTPPKPPARLGWPRTGQRGPGVRYASPGRLAQRARLPGRRPRSERAHHHTGARERRAPKTRTGTHPGRGQARAKPAPQGVGLTQGTRRAPPMWSERNERNRRGAQPRRVGRGRPAGRGVRALHRAPCRGEKERGSALAGWPSFKCGRFRVPPSSVHLYLTTTFRCCQALLCSFLVAEKLPGCLAATLRGTLPPWGGRGGCCFAVAAQFCAAERKKPLTVWRGCGMVRLSVAFR